MINERSCSFPLHLCSFTFTHTPNTLSVLGSGQLRRRSEKNSDELGEHALPLAIHVRLRHCCSSPLRARRIRRFLWEQINDLMRAPCRRSASTSGRCRSRLAGEAARRAEPAGSPARSGDLDVVLLCRRTTAPWRGASS